MDQLRWAIIGTGRFGRIHARLLQGMPDVNLAALCNRSPDKLADAAAELGVQQTFTDYRRLLDEPDLDVVTIATHWQDHYEPALAALEAGKHVLLEKPMAPSAAQCAALVAAAERSPGMLLVGHVCRFDPRYSLARQAIQEGRIGRIVSMHARRNLRKAPGSLRLDKISPLMGDGIHDVDLMLWLSGQVPTQVYARTVRVHNYTYPDLGWAMLHFGESAVGVVETAWCLPENTPYTIDARLEILGSEGAIYVDCGNAGLTIHDPAGAHLPDTAYWPQQHQRHVGALANEVRYFIDCIQRQQAPQVITPQEAARAVAVVETAEQAAAQGQVLPFQDEPDD